MLIFLGKGLQYLFDFHFSRAVAKSSHIGADRRERDTTTAIFIKEREQFLIVHQILGQHVVEYALVFHFQILSPANVKHPNNHVMSFTAISECRIYLKKDKCNDKPKPSNLQTSQQDLLQI